jgi:hypothetical protein
MSQETANQVLSSAQPRGLKRLTLLILALSATDGGQLSFGEADQQRLAGLCSMKHTRFERIVRELQADGYLSLDEGVLTLYGGGPTGGVEDQRTSLLGSGVKGTSGDSKGGDSSQSAVSEVLACYDEAFKPQQWGEDDRREVRAALQVATVEQLKKAIWGNKASDYHQGSNERRKKYNTLSHIIRGKQGKKTRREVIFYFIDIYEKAAATKGHVKSDVDPAIVTTRKEEVRRAHRLRHDQEAQERGRRAERWLAEQGIETVRKDDGYPVWPEGGPQ